MSLMTLAEAFLAAAAANAAATDAGPLEAALDALVREGRAAWPAIEQDAAQFCAHLARHYGAEPLDRWPPVHAGDLWLASACAAGDVRAAAELDARHRAIVDQVVGRLRLTGDQANEVRQRLRARLLVGEPGHPPRISTYSGRGELAGWVRVAATRTALDLVRAERAGGAADELVDRLPAAGDDPELRLLKTRYAEPFARAFRAAIAALEPRDRLLLKQHYLDGLSTETLAPLHGAHRVTIARWLDAARSRVAAETERQLGELLRLPKAELESLMRAVRSRIEVSLHDFLSEVSRR